AALHAQREVADDLSLAEAFEDMLRIDHRLRFDVVLCQSQLRRAGRAEHRRPLRPHLMQLGEAALVATAARGDSALQPVRLDRPVSVELLEGPLLLTTSRLGPGLEPPKADLGPS